jgi:hypothetical protein
MEFDRDRAEQGLPQMAQIAQIGFVKRSLSPFICVICDICGKPGFPFEARAKTACARAPPQKDQNPDLCARRGIVKVQHEPQSTMAQAFAAIGEFVILSIFTF